MTSEQPNCKQPKKKSCWERQEEKAEQRQTEWQEKTARAIDLTQTNLGKPEHQVTGVTGVNEEEAQKSYQEYRRKRDRSIRKPCQG
ncbi:MAG: hypothetical protein NW220_16855 [Leptolyngbyaceae cyanobacterium bins.349]|nr:hypothetical protein [Leptolyngbyaceae cyanobacterium bins.349]